VDELIKKIGRIEKKGVAIVLVDMIYYLSRFERAHEKQAKQ
jgi:hypothetical protein